MSNSRLKESNIEWLGKIPKNWKLMHNKYLLKKKKSIISKYNNEKILSLTMNGVIERDLTAGGKMPSSFNGYQKLEKGNLLLCLFDIDVTPRCVGIIPTNGITSPAYSQFILNKGKANLKYYYYYFLMLDNQKTLVHLSKNLRNTLSEQEFGNLISLCPPLKEQKQIADFLDKKVLQIDDISKKIQQEITDLEKYRKSIITKAVTKGLSPNVPMKNSNISWIGEVPSNWHIEKLKFIAETRNNKELLSNVQNNYIGLENIVKNTGQYVCSNTTYEEGYYDVCKKGDILYGKLRPNLSKVLVAPFDSCCSGEFLIFKSAKINLKYLFYYLLSQGITEIATSAIYGTKMPRVSWDFIKNLFISFPPKNEDQKEIVNYLDIQCNKIDSILKNKHILLKKLNQYKQSIIYEYVTGKKQVPTEEGAVE